MPWCEEGIFFLEFHFVECLVMTHGRITIVEIVLDMGRTTVKNEQTNKKKNTSKSNKEGAGWGGWGAVCKFFTEPECKTKTSRQSD